MAASQIRTDIALQFDEISSVAERMLLKALTEHYDVVTEQVSEEVEQIVMEITHIITIADGPTILKHTDTMKLTEANLLKKESKRLIRGQEPKSYWTSTAQRNLPTPLHPRTKKDTNASPEIKALATPEENKSAKDHPGTSHQRPLIHDHQEGTGQPIR